MADTWDVIAKRLRTEAPDRVLMLKGAVVIEALAEELAALAKPASSPAGGDVREAMETQGPYEAWFCKDTPADCCDYGVVSLSEGREVCRAWREQDARAIAAALAKPATSDDWNTIARRMQRAGAPGTEEELEHALRAALSQSTSAGRVE